MSDEASNVEPSWAYWEAALAGDARGFDLKDGDFHQGYYRNKAYIPVAIWFRNGMPIMKMGTKEAAKTVTDRVAIADTFRHVSQFPVTHEDYSAAFASGQWPGHIEPIKVAATVVEADQPVEESRIGIGGNNPPDEFKLLASEIDEWTLTLTREMEKGAVEDEGRRLRVDSIKDKLASLEARAEAMRVSEKAPHLEASRLVDEKWKPIVRHADTQKRRAAVFLQPYLEKVRREEEAARLEYLRQKREAERLAAETGQISAPSLSAPPTQPRSATKKSSTRLRVRQVVEFTDIKATLAHFAKFEVLPADLVVVLRRLADSQLRARINVPGAYLKDEEYAV